MKASWHLWIVILVTTLANTGCESGDDSPDLRAAAALTGLSVRPRSSSATLTGTRSSLESASGVTASVQVTGSGLNTGGAGALYFLREPERLMALVRHVRQLRGTQRARSMAASFDCDGDSELCETEGSYVLSGTEDCNVGGTVTVGANGTATVNETDTGLQYTINAPFVYTNCKALAPDFTDFPNFAFTEIDGTLNYTGVMITQIDDSVAGTVRGTVEEISFARSSSLAVNNGTARSISVVTESAVALSITFTADADFDTGEGISGTFSGTIKMTGKAGTDDVNISATFNETF